MNSRTISLLLALVSVAGFYVYQNPWLIRIGSPEPSAVAARDRTASLPLDEETKAEIRHYFEGITVAPEENNLNYAIQLDHGSGRPQISEGNYREAYRTYQKVLAISYQQGSLMGIGLALIVLSEVAERGGNQGEALRGAILGYKMAEAMNNNEEKGVAELRLAKLLKKQDRSLSMVWLLRAKESLKGTRYQQDYVSLLSDLAENLKAFGESKGASELYEEAWESAQSLGNSPSQKWPKWEAGKDLADDLMRSEQYEKAAAVLQKTQSYFTESEKSTVAYTRILHRLARIHASLKENQEAGRHYLSAYANYEVTRADSPGEEALAALDNGHKRLIDDFVAYHLESKDYAEALALLESNKARTLNDILEDPSYKQVASQWKEMERRHATELMALLENESEQLQPLQDDQSLSQFLSLAKMQENERRTLQTRLQLRDITVTRSLSKEQVEDIRHQLPPDVAVLSFFVQTSQVSAFLITQQGIRYVPLSLDAAEMYRAAQLLRVTLTNPYNDFYREPAQKLFRKGLAPVIEKLPAETRIIVYSPDGILSRIPLEVLMDGERFLGERYAVYRVPSLRYVSSIAGVKAKPAQTGVSCVDPEVYNARLPFQRETAETLQELYGRKVIALSGSQCSESRLAAAIRENTDPAFLHVGAHGNFYPDSAMNSAIWLSSEDGSGEAHPWNARAMATVDMSHLDLVTLSSCETGLTDPAMQRDVFGIARALFFAGARAIIAPLWVVHDQATAELMQEFYQAYSTGTPAVLSLQQAQQKLLKTSEYRHPYYWSAFILTGALQ